MQTSEAQAPVSSLTERIELRSRNRKRWLIGGAIGLVLLLAAGAVAYFSPLLNVDTVTVEGTELTDPNEVHDYVLDRVAGTPLPQVPLRRLSQATLEQFPKTEDVSIRWSGPRQITVDVTDRTPVLAVPSGSTWTRFDSAGHEIDQVDDPTGVITLSSRGKDAEAITAALELLNQFSEEEIENFTAIYANSPTDVRVDYRTGDDADDDSTVQIRFGSADDAALKLERAKALTQRAKEYVDVSMPDHPVTK